MASDPLEIQRKLMFDSLNSLLGFYSRPEGNTLMEQMQGRAAGADQPFTPGVVNSQLAQNADASAGQFNNERDLIRQAFANAGLGGSGLETSGLINAQRRANAMTRGGRNEITSRAELENYQARERAQTQVQSYLAQKQANEAAARAAEVGLRSQMSMEGDNTQAGAGPYGSPTNGANGQSIVPGPTGQQPGTAAGTMPPAAPIPPRPTSRMGAPLAPNLNQFYQTTGLPMNMSQIQQRDAGYNQAMEHYNMGLQQYALQQQGLAQRQGAWDMQYGGR